MWTWILWKQGSRRSEKHTAGLGIIRYQRKKIPNNNTTKNGTKTLPAKVIKNWGRKWPRLEN